MTYQEAITRFDALKYNTYSDAEKLNWLYNLELEIFFEIYSHYEDAPKEMTLYNDPEIKDKQLMVSAPYDVLYLRYLEAMVDYQNGEFGKFNNSCALYKAAWQDYQRYYNRTHMPLHYCFKFL